VKDLKESGRQFQLACFGDPHPDASAQFEHQFNGSRRR
jgi:hypothetical protein